MRHGETASVAAAMCLSIWAALQAGCTSGPRVQATVAAAPCSGAGRAGAAQPLAGASVSMMCPQVIKADGASLFGRTDARGRLDFEEHAFGRWIHDGCELVVEMPGFDAVRYPVADVCAEYEANHCVRAVIQAELVRSDIAARRCP